MKKEDTKVFLKFSNCFPRPLHNLGCPLKSLPKFNLFRVLGLKLSISRCFMKVTGKR